MKMVVTGAAGLLGWHTAVHLHAANCSARFHDHQEPWELVQLDHAGFNNDAILQQALRGATAVLHFAGVNRGPEAEVEAGNPAIAGRLADAYRALGAPPHIVYANSIHSASDTPYGRSKRIAGEILSKIGGPYTDLILPHIFGEGARPRYNNITATFIEAVIAGQMPWIDPHGQVDLLHAGAAAQIAIDAVATGTTGALRPEPHSISVPELFEKIHVFHNSYGANVCPDLSHQFDVALFNSYRSALYPQGFPRTLKRNTDPRGSLFEAVKGGGGGQVFVSWTEPGVIRGDHFHLQKVERFLVLEGEAVIRIRRVLGGPVWEYRVSGREPAAVDMPTLHTHSIENIADRPLLTLFWTHDLFDPDAPDTYADPVLK